MNWDKGIQAYQLQAVLTKSFSDCDTHYSPRLTLSVAYGNKFYSVHPTRKLLQSCWNKYSLNQTKRLKVCFPVVHLCRRNCRMITALRVSQLLNVKTSAVSCEVCVLKDIQYNMNIH
jgi:hypothetical protein